MSYRASLNLRTTSKKTLAKPRNCRGLPPSSRGRTNAAAEKLEREWRELRRHVTIERDQEKMLRLRAELDKRGP
jgi:hypothetical protein